MKLKLILFFISYLSFSLLHTHTSLPQKTNTIPSPSALSSCISLLWLIVLLLICLISTPIFITQRLTTVHPHDSHYRCIAAPHMQETLSQVFINYRLNRHTSRSHAVYSHNKISYVVFKFGFIECMWHSFTGKKNKNSGVHNKIKGRNSPAKRNSSSKI